VEICFVRPIRIAASLVRVETLKISLEIRHNGNRRYAIVGVPMTWVQGTVAVLIVETSEELGRWSLPVAVIGTQQAESQILGLTKLALKPMGFTNKL
jgi:hypothetical protein